MTEQRNKTALPHGEFFPDAELVSWIGEHYGLKLAEHVAEILADDPQSIRGFTRAVRRSVTHEIEERS